MILLLLPLFFTQISSIQALVVSTPLLLPRTAPAYAVRNLATITKIYDTVSYPNNLPILQHGSSAVPPGLFNANASGRVTPLGNFTGFADSTEYFFALSPNPGQTGPGIITPNYNALKTRVVEFSSQCAEVASSVVYLDTIIVHPGNVDDGKYITTLKEIAFWRFDDAGAVLYYDAWIPNLALWADTFLGQNLADPVVQTLAILTNLCQQIQARCTGNNTQYLDVLTCTLALRTKVFGTFDEVWGDNVVCRLVHVILTQVRPDVHCPHVGPTGGGKCVNIDYTTGYIADDSLLYGGEGQFICPA